MPLEIDKFGVPHFGGKAEDFDEYCERAWDLFYGRQGNASMQAATALNLRSALTDTAYQSARGITHADLLVQADKDGVVPETAVKRLLEVMKADLVHEKPTRAAELFDKVFYSETVWRGIGEPMQAYIVRRNKELADLKDVSQTTAVSTDIQGHLLLKFSGTPPNAWPAIIGSAGNSYERDGVAKALRMQLPHIHEKDLGRQAPRRTDAGDRRQQDRPFRRPQQGYKSMPSGHVAEDSADDDQEEYDDGEAFEVDVEDEDHDSVGEAALHVDIEDQNDIDAFAVTAQKRGKFFGKGGKGKGSASSRAPPPPPKADRDSQKRFDQKKRERDERLKIIKASSKCNVCQEMGHWYRDKECKGKKAIGGSRGPGPKTRSGYFVLADVDSEPEPSGFVVAKQKEAMTEPCEHALKRDG